MSASPDATGPAFEAISPGRFTRATIHSPAGELEARLSEAGNWQLRIRSEADNTWRFVCDGDMDSGASLAALTAAGEEPLRLGPVTVDRAARAALVQDSEVRLAHKEFALLATLATQPNRVFTKTELLRAIWGYPTATSSRTLDSHASRLRCKLHDAGAPGVVINKRGIGYRFWEVADLLSAPAPASAA